PSLPIACSLRFARHGTRDQENKGPRKPDRHPTHLCLLVLSVPVPPPSSSLSPSTLCPNSLGSLAPALPPAPAPAWRALHSRSTHPPAAVALAPLARFLRRAR